MNALLATAVLSLSALSHAQTTGQTNSNDGTSACPSPGGAHIIVARASTEPQGFGIIGAVKDIVLSRVPGSTAEAVVYPATLQNYVQSESDGVVAMKALVNNFIANCANTPLVLLGYSQGAQVTADTLVGQEVRGFSTNASIADPLPDSTLSRVAAAVIMGDPTFVTTETFHIGNATKNGIFLREDVSRFDATNLASRIQSYCNEGDPYCASGNFTQIMVHLEYVKLYGESSANFIVDQIESWYKNNTGSSASMSSIPLPTVSVTRSVPAASASSMRNATKTGSMGLPTATSASSTPIPATGAASSMSASYSLLTALSSVVLGSALAMML